MYRIGIDLGGTNIAVGLVGEDFKILSKKSTPTRTSRPPVDMFPRTGHVKSVVCLTNNRLNN